MFSTFRYIFKFSSLEIPSATSTWKSQDFPTKQIAGEFVFNNADSPGSFSALLPDFFVIPKAVSVEFLSFLIFGKIQYLWG